jgi:hypothetical protein
LRRPEDDLLARRKAFRRAASSAADGLLGALHYRHSTEPFEFHPVAASKSVDAHCNKGVEHAADGGLLRTGCAGNCLDAC